MRRISLLGLAAALIGCSTQPVTQSVHSVEIVYAQPQGELSETEYTGRVVSDGQVNLGFKVAGQVQHLYVHAGENVRAGQVLARLDTSDYYLQHRINITRYNQVKEEVGRVRTLYERHAVSKNDIEKAEAGLEQCRVALDGGQRQINYCTLRAPESAQILSVNTREGELVDAGMAVLTLVADGRKEVVVEVPQREQLRSEEVQSIVASSNGVNYPLELVAFSPKQDANQLYQMRLQFKSPNALVEGENVSVHLYYSNCSEPALVLPLHAVFEKDDANYVWVVQADSTVTATPVSVRIGNRGEALIFGGIDTTQPIVRAGVHHLVEGEKVNILPPASKTNIGNQL